MKPNRTSFKLFQSFGYITTVLIKCLIKLTRLSNQNYSYKFAICKQIEFNIM